MTTEKKEDVTEKVNKKSETEAKSETKTKSETETTSEAEVKSKAASDVKSKKEKAKKESNQKEKTKKEKVKKEKKPREKLQITEEDRKMLKKQTRRLVISIVVLIVLIGAYFGLKAYSKKLAAKEASQTDVMGTICNATVSDITAFHYTYNGEEYSYEKSGDTWTCENDTSLEMDSSLIEAALGSLSGIDYYSVIEGSADLSQYGLDADYMTVGWTEAGNTYELYVGDSNAITGYRYVRLSVNDTVYVADTTVTSSFAKTPEDFEVVAEEETTEDTETTDAAAETTETTAETADATAETADATAETTDATAEAAETTVTAE